MPLSRAEIQKRYREKKKKESGNFTKDERERKRKAYIPTSMLSDVEAKKRQTSTLKRVKQHYKKKREETKELMKSECVQTRQTSNNTTLTIKMNFEKKGHKAGTSKATLAKTAQDVEVFKAQNSELIKDKKRLQKRLERSNRKIKEYSQLKFQIANQTENRIVTDENSVIDSDGTNKDLRESNINPNQTKENLTPRSKANKDLRDYGLSPRKHTKLTRRLLQFHVLKEEVKVTKAIRKFGMNTARKYKCLRAFGNMLGMSRKSLVQKKKGASNRRTLLQDKVHAFLEREDNCVTMPGKKDQKNKHQKRILTDYLHNLHSKFLLENPDTKISRSAFSKMRPKHILLVNFCNRNTCLCSRHQNIALKIKAIQDIAGTKNPDDFIAKNTDGEVQEKLQHIDKPDVTYTEWKRQEENGKLRWKQVQTVVSKETFSTMFTQDVKDFREHVNRVKNQYNQMRRLRENLDDGHVLVWMDFAENFTCAALDEVQSAYWTSEQVTLHTTVVYFPKSHHKSHKSVVGISDLNIHNAGMVVSMVSKLIPIIKSEYPDLKYVHYLTDSPTSQYRNKSIFEFLTRHETLFGVGARWDFLESGHGKGPCDGLGGSVKWSADMAVKQGKVVIQNAKDFYAWAGAQSESETAVSYYYVAQEMYQASAEEMKEKNAILKPITGTFKLHAVVPIGDSKIASRDLSCNCKSCLSDVLISTCEGWKIQDIIKPVKKSGKAKRSETKGMPEEVIKRNELIEEDVSELNPNVDNATVSQSPNDNNGIEPIKADIGEYCAALYESEWYIGIITDIDTSAGKSKVNFMEEIGNTEISFRWPSKRDEIWVKNDDIMMKVPSPYQSGYRRKLYKLGPEIIDIIETVFEKRLK